MYANPNAAQIQALQAQIVRDEREADKVRKKYKYFMPETEKQTLAEIEARVKRNQQRANELVRALWG